MVNSTVDQKKKYVKTHFFSNLTEFREEQQKLQGSDILLYF